MRSQLLIQIEQFSGVVIFATNLASNYDTAFVTRIKSIQFKKPDMELRKRMWEMMLLPTLPLAAYVDTRALAAIDDVCGRDIKNAIVKAAIAAAVEDEPLITQGGIEKALRDIIEENRKITGKLSSEEKKEIEGKIKRQLRKDKAQERRRHR
jgi:AAA+ superfamily predicted ATPase